jgi:hypothetical protein
MSDTSDVWQDSVTNYRGIASSCKLIYRGIASSCKLKIVADASRNRIYDRETLCMYVCVRGGPNQPLHRDPQWSIVLPLL